MEPQDRDPRRERSRQIIRHAGRGSGPGAETGRHRARQRRRDSGTRRRGARDATGAPGLASPDLAPPVPGPAPTPGRPRRNPRKEAVREGPPRPPPHPPPAPAASRGNSLALPRRSAAADATAVGSARPAPAPAPRASGKPRPPPAPARALRAPRAHRGGLGRRALYRFRPARPLPPAPLPSRPRAPSLSAQISSPAAGSTWGARPPASRALPHPPPSPRPGGRAPLPRGARGAGRTRGPVEPPVAQGKRCRGGLSRSRRRGARSGRQPSGDVGRLRGPSGPEAVASPTGRRRRSRVWGCVWPCAGDEDVERGRSCGVGGRGRGQWSSQVSGSKEEPFLPSGHGAADDRRGGGGGSWDPAFRSRRLRRRPQGTRDGRGSESATSDTKLPRP